MRTIIKLVFAGALSRMEKAYLAQMLADALSDFRAARGPTPEEYIMRRYQQGSVLPMTEEAIEYKLKSLNVRIDLAQKLHDAALSAEVTEEEEPICVQCASPRGNSTNEFCSEECTLQHDREAYEGKP